MRADEIDRRLTEWASAYGGGRYENLGYASENILHRLGIMGGFCPDPSGRIPSREATPADEVEAIVRRMEAGAMWELAQVLRCDYFRPGIGMAHRLDLLRKNGVAMAERNYYMRLSEAKEVVAYALGHA